jgi:hypothetical protein
MSSFSRCPRGKASWASRGARERRHSTAFMPLRLESLEPRLLLSTYTPTTTSDSNPSFYNTLRAAIIAANAHPGADTIQLGKGTYRLSIPAQRSYVYKAENNAYIGDLDVTDTLTIVGAGRDATTINAQEVDRVIESFGTLTLKNLTITGGVATNNYEPGGGGIYSHADLTLINCRVTGNRAEPFSGGESDHGLGGGIYAVRSLTLTNTIVSSNSTSTCGGGIYSAYGSTSKTNVLTNCTISSNTAGSDGGGMFLSGGNWTFTNTAISSNTGSSCSFTSYGNRACRGGGIYGGANLKFVTCTLTGNSSGPGAAISSDGAIELRQCTISSNTARCDSNSPGGAIDAGSILAYDSTFNNNCGTMGGAVYCGSGTFNDCTFTGNTAQKGGAVLGSATLVGCTVAGNFATGTWDNHAGGGLHGSMTLLNTIVAGNTATKGSNDLEGAFVSAGHNLIGDGTGATGLTDGVNGDQVGTADAPIDPKLGPLQNNGGSTKTMALLAGSPAIDAGTDSYIPASTDQRGCTRVLDGDLDGTAVVDIGAYEYNAGPSVSAVAVAESAAPKNGVLESTDKLVISFAVASGLPLKSNSLTVDGKAITAINGPFSGKYYSASLGTRSVGTHSYTIKTTDTQGVTFTKTGTFVVSTPAPPSVGSVVVAEAAAPKNGILESTDKLIVSWAASSQFGVKTQQLAIDGKAIATINGPYSGLYYYAAIGKLPVGKHTYAIKSTDAKGYSTTVGGTFSVSPQVDVPRISNVTIAEAAAPKDGIIKANESIAISWNLTDVDGIASISLTVDGTEVAPTAGPSGNTYRSVLDPLVAGSHAYVIQATDVRGLSAMYSGTFSVVADTPQISNATATPTLIEPGFCHFRVSWTLADTDGIAYCGLSLNDSSVTISSISPRADGSGIDYSADCEFLLNGTYHYVITVRDSAGKSSSCEGYFEVVCAFHDLRIEASTAPESSADTLTNAQLTPIVAEAIARLELQGGSEVESAMSWVTIEVADLADGVLGSTLGNTIRIDRDAAGYGWFVDTTPGDDLEFVADELGVLTAPKDGAAGQHADLLTAVMHEMGHVLGYSHIVADDLLPLGTRRTEIIPAEAT